MIHGMEHLSYKERAEAVQYAEEKAPRLTDSSLSVSKGELQERSIQIL